MAVLFNNGGTFEFLIPLIALTGSTSDPGTDYRLAGESVAPSPPAPGMRTAPGPREDGRLIETVGSTYSSLPAPGMRTAPRSREDGSLLETVGTTCSSPPTPGMRAAPDPRESGRFSAAVGPSPPAPGMLAAPGSHEDGRTIAAVDSPPRAPGVHNAPGLRLNDTSRNFPLASSPDNILRHSLCTGVTPRI